MYMAVKYLCKYVYFPSGILSFERPFPPWRIAHFVLCVPLTGETLILTKLCLDSDCRTKAIGP